jgi:hypothetical protein
MREKLRLDHLTPVRVRHNAARSTMRSDRPLVQTGRLPAYKHCETWSLRCKQSSMIRSARKLAMQLRMNRALLHAVREDDPASMVMHDW